MGRNNRSGSSSSSQSRSNNNNTVDDWTCKRDKYGRTILHDWCSQSDKLVHVDWLLQQCPENSKYVRDKENGYTALHRAIYARDLRMLLLLLNKQTLLDQQPQQQVKDHEGFTPLDLLNQLYSEDTLSTLSHIHQQKKIKNKYKNNHHENCRSRSNSFLTHPDSDSEEEEEEDDDQPPHADIISFPTATSTTRSSRNVRYSSSKKRYGTEVLTFGSQDHPALGQFRSSKYKEGVIMGRVEIFASKQAVDVAVASHHTIVLTSEGHLYSFGLGKGGKLGTGSTNNVFIPQRILLKKTVTSVAAATNHSLCTTTDGYVYGWGSNRFGQLGCKQQRNSMIVSPTKLDGYNNCTKVAAGEKHSVILSNNNGQVYIEGTCPSGNNNIIWNGQLIGVDIAASDTSTMVLAYSKGTNQQLQHVYTWGQGIPTPTKVNIPTKNNPVKIACANHHNVVITNGGEVFTWGLSSDAIMNKKSWTLPQLIPLNERAVQVSASDHHTAVLTSNGSLYTWGACNNDTSNRSLGHSGVKYQPCPKRVPGVFRAVQVATAREHTALLIGVTYPPLPKTTGMSSLQQICEESTCQHVDIFNVLPILILAERHNLKTLANYCFLFIQHNLDTVLSMAKKHYLETFLQDGFYYLSNDNIESDLNDYFSPSIVTNLSNNDNGKQKPQQEVSMKYSNSKTNLNNNTEDYPKTSHPSLRAVTLSKVPCNISNASDVGERYESLAKAIRSIRKKIKFIQNLEEKLLTSPQNDMAPLLVSEEQMEKVARRPELEADLALLKPLYDQIKVKMEQYQFMEKQQSKKDIPICPKAPPTPEKEEEQRKVPTYECQICNVSCPDETSLSLHVNGRRHRNRQRLLEEKEKEEAAQRLLNAPNPKPVSNYVSPFIMNEKKTMSSIQPKYTLSPPARPSITKQQPSKTWATTVDLSKSIPRKTTPSPVQKMASKLEFKQILKEEEQQRQKQVITPMKEINSPWNKKSNSPSWTSNSLKTPPPNMASLVAPMSTSPGSLSVSLGSFLTLSEGKQSPKQIKSNQSPKLKWNVPAPVVPSNCLRFGGDVCNLRTKPTGQSANKKISLSDIQRQEEELKAKADTNHQTLGGKWYVERRERAASIENIQRFEEEERKRRQQEALLIEEQKCIEENIKQENKKMGVNTKGTKKKKKNHNSNNNNKKKEQQKKPHQKQKQEKNQRLPSNKKKYPTPSENNSKNTAASDGVSTKNNEKYNDIDSRRSKQSRNGSKLVNTNNQKQNPTSNKT